MISDMMIHQKKYEQLQKKLDSLIMNCEISDEEFQQKLHEIKGEAEKLQKKLLETKL